MRQSLRNRQRRRAREALASAAAAATSAETPEEPTSDDDDGAHEPWVPRQGANGGGAFTTAGIPTEAIAHVLSYLSARDLGTVRRASSMFNHAGGDERFWQRHLKEDFRVQPEAAQTHRGAAAAAEYRRRVVLHGKRSSALRKQNRNKTLREHRQRRDRACREHWVLYCIPESRFRNIDASEVWMVAALIRIAICVAAVVLGLLFPRPGGAVWRAIITFLRYYAYNVGLHLPLLMTVVAGFNTLTRVAHEIPEWIREPLRLTNKPLWTGITLVSAAITVAMFWLWLSPLVFALRWLGRCVLPVVRLAVHAFTMFGFVTFVRRRDRPTSQLFAVSFAGSVVAELLVRWTGLYWPPHDLYHGVLFVLRGIAIGWVLFFSAVSVAEVVKLFGNNRRRVDKAVFWFVLMGVAAIMAFEFVVVNWWCGAKTLYSLGVGSVVRAVLHVVTIADWIILGIAYTALLWAEAKFVPCFYRQDTPLVWGWAVGATLVAGVLMLADYGMGADTLDMLSFWANPVARVSAMAAEMAASMTREMELGRAVIAASRAAAVATQRVVAGAITLGPS